VLHTWIASGGLGGGIGGGTDKTGSSVTLNRSVALSTPKLSLKTCTSHTVYLLLVVTAVALLFSTAYLLLTRAFTKWIMHTTLILSIALNVFVCLLEPFLDANMNLYLQRNLRVLLDYTILLFVSFLSLIAPFRL